MGRIYRQPKDIEKFLIREFVIDAIGFSIARAQWCESPDAILTLIEKGGKRRIAIEHTGYFNDTRAGTCSPLTPIVDFWQRVQSSLERRISHRKHLADITGRVRLDMRRFSGQAKPEIQEAMARRLAEEIVCFLEAHLITVSSQIPSRSAISFDSGSPEFSDHPVLKSLVGDMTLRRHPGNCRRPRYSWVCSNITAGSIGINLDYIKTSVQKKNKKAAKYDWRSADEKWLLLVAAGGNLSEHGGLPDETDWSDPDLRQLCYGSPFDRIYFWERIRSWYKPLKPERRIVCLKEAANLV